MDEYRQTKEVDDDIVETLAGLPVRNLESRIALLEEALRDRQRLSDRIQSELGTHRIRRESVFERLRYSSEETRGLLRGEMLRIDSLRHADIVTAFEHELKLREKLEEAKEALTLAILRQTLVKEGPGEPITEADTDGNGRSKGSHSEA